MAHSHYIAWADESTYGTAPGSVANRLDIAGESLKRRIEAPYIRPERRHAPVRQVETRRSVSGAIDVYLSYHQLGQMLRRLVTVPTTEDLGSGAYRHTFRPDPQATPPSMTVDVARDIELHRFTGIFFTGGRLSFGLVDKHFGMSLTCLGAEMDPGGALPPIAESQFSAPAHVGDTGATTPFQLQLSDGSTTWTADADSIDISSSWDRRLHKVERSLTPVGILGGGIVSASGKVQVLYGSDSDFLLDAIDSRADVSLALTMQGDLIGGGIYQGLEVTLPICKVNGDPPTLRSSGRGNIGFAVELGALYSEALSYGPLQYRLTNSTASYT